MLLTAHNLRYYADLIGAMRAAIEAGSLADFAAAFESCAMSLTQLGHPTKLPASPDAAVLETVPNPHPGLVYLVRFTCPEFTSLCPVTGQPDFAHFVIDYVPEATILESKSLKLYLGAFRNHSGIPRRLHSGYRPPTRRHARPTLAADRRLLVSARRHPDRRLLPDGRAAGRAVAARSRCRTLSRARLSQREAEPKG